MVHFFHTYEKQYFTCSLHSSVKYFFGFTTCKKKNQFVWKEKTASFATTTFYTYLSEKKSAVLALRLFMHVQMTVCAHSGLSVKKYSFFEVQKVHLFNSHTISFLFLSVSVHLFSQNDGNADVSAYLFSNN